MAAMRSFAVTLLAALVATAATGCGSSGDEATPVPSTVTELETQSSETAREAAPALAGVSLSGDAIALGDFLGRPVLVNVWSSW